MDSTNPDDGIRIGNLHIRRHRGKRGFAIKCVTGGEVVLYQADLAEVMQFIVANANPADLSRMLRAMNEVMPVGSLAAALNR